MKNSSLRIFKSADIHFLFLLFILIIFLSGCYSVLEREADNPKEALSQVNCFFPGFRDDMDLISITRAIENNLGYLNRLDPEDVFFYGRDEYTCQHVRESQELFLDLIQKKPDLKEFNRAMKKNFRIYRATGRPGNRHVLFTGYFEPVFEASLSPDERFKYPIYRMPDDLIRIDLSLFHEKYNNDTIIGRIEGKKVLPYYSRKQIETERMLNGKGLEIAWLKDPIDVAFLHIQGSGRLRLKNGDTLSVGYMASNGRPYHSIGRYMLDRNYMDREEMSMQSIRNYLRSHPEIIDRVLNHNPSYVFFRVVRDGPFGNIHVPLTPGRSIALSSRLFPKGALCFIKSKKPVINSDDEIEKWTKFSRFIINQDTGGAIKGAGRADIFWGRGKYAEIAAGHMKHEGELYVLIKKP